MLSLLRLPSAAPVRQALSDPLVLWTKIFCLLSCSLLNLIHISKIWAGYHIFFFFQLNYCWADCLSSFSSQFTEQSWQLPTKMVFFRWCVIIFSEDWKQRAVMVNGIAGAQARSWRLLSQETWDFGREKTDPRPVAVLFAVLNMWSRGAVFGFLRWKPDQHPE